MSEVFKPRYTKLGAVGGRLQQCNAVFCHRSIALLNIENKKIERPDCIVELNETAVTKRKYNTGRPVRTVWCVGEVCRQHKTFFLKLTTIMDALSLDSIFRNNVHSSSVFITDAWKGYKNVKKVFAGHKTIKHKKHFVCSYDPAVHTQTIESLWVSLKRFIK
ncbi:hypothetical protein CDIK_2740 [Cucumispora dikerogammari]|nr:hypothetical protein CDIK_2740 [Cucumispora dikerogammari]